MPLMRLSGANGTWIMRGQCAISAGSFQRRSGSKAKRHGPSSEVQWARCSCGRGCRAAPAENVVMLLLLTCKTTGRVRPHPLCNFTAASAVGVLAASKSDTETQSGDSPVLLTWHQHD